MKDRTRSPRAWRLVLRAELLLWRHGWWAVGAALALLTAAALWQWELQPTAQRIAALRLDSRAPRPVAVAAPVDDRAAVNRQRLDAFRAALRPYREHTQIVRRIAAATANDLQWTQAEFQPSRDSAAGIARLQIAVPSAGDYRHLRQGLERALREVPSLSLDQVTFRREQANEAQLDAKLKLSLWLLAPEGEQPPDVETARASR